MTLLEIIKNGLSYDCSCAVYSQKIDGRFQENSPARIGQRCFDNGGLLDDSEFFGSNENILDSIQTYTEGDEQFNDEAIAELILNINEN